MRWWHLLLTALVSASLVDPHVDPGNENLSQNRLVGCRLRGGEDGIARESPLEIEERWARKDFDGVSKYDLKRSSSRRKVKRRGAKKNLVAKRLVSPTRTTTDKSPESSFLQIKNEMDSWQWTTNQTLDHIDQILSRISTPRTSDATSGLSDTPRSKKEDIRQVDQILFSSQAKLRDPTGSEYAARDVQGGNDADDFVRLPRKVVEEEERESLSPELEDLQRFQRDREDWNWGAEDWDDPPRHEPEFNFDQYYDGEEEEPDDEVNLHQAETSWDQTLSWKKNQVADALRKREKGEEREGLAEIAYERALASDPMNFETMLNFANYLYVQKRNITRALALYKLAIGQEPNHVPTLSNYGRLLQEMGGDDAQVKQIFLRVLDLDPHNVRVLEQMAILSLTKEKDLTRSQLYYQASLEADERSEYKRKLTAESLCTYAALLEDLHRHDEAAAVYEKALSRNPKHVASLFNYGLMLETSLKQPANAAEMYSRILKINPQHHLTLCNYGGLLESALHDYVEAEVMYMRALALKPNDANTLYNYAGLLEDFRKDPASALLMYEKALQDQPDHAPSLFAMARLQWANRSIESAGVMRQLERVLQIDPNHIGSLNLLSRITLEVQGDVEKSMYLAKQALLLDPNNVDAANNCGEFSILECYARIEEYDWKPMTASNDFILLSTKYLTFEEKHRRDWIFTAPDEQVADARVFENSKLAVTYFEKALALCPSSTTSLRGLAAARVMERDYQAAQRVYKQLSPHLATNFALTIEFLSFLQISGCKQEALSYMSQCFEQWKDNDIFLLHYGMLLKDLNTTDVKQVISVFERVLEVNPKSQDAVHELLLLTSSSYSLPPHLARLINTTHLRLSDPDTALSFYHRLLPELNVRFLSREIRDEDFTSRARAALKALQHASELCEKSCELLCLLAELHWYLEEEEEAEICFRKSLSVHDSYERALVEFPRFLLQTARADVPIIERHFAEAVKMFPNNSYALSGLASFLYSLKLRHCVLLGTMDDVELVNGLFSRAHLLDPTNVEALQGLGLISRAFLFNDTQAISYYREALEIEPNTPDLMVNYAIASFVNNDTETADKMFELALRLHPGEPEVKQMYSVFLDHKFNNDTAGDEYFFASLGMDQETFEREVKSWKQEEVEARNCMDENEVQLM